MGFVTAGTGGSAAAVDYKTNWLTKAIHGKYTTTSRTPVMTYQIVTELEAPFQAIRVAIPNLHTASVPGVKVSVGVLETLPAYSTTGPSIPGNTFTQAYFKGADNVELPAQIAATRPSWTLSDEVTVPSIDRTDGGTRPIVIVRVEYPANSTMTGAGGTNALGNWNTASALRPWMTYGAGSGAVSNPNNQVTGVSLGVDTPAIAIQYLSKAAGKQVLLIGDSTIEGAQASPYGTGTFQRVLTANSTPKSPIEYFNAAIFGELPSVYVEKMKDVAGFVYPTSVFYLACSINQANSTGQYSSRSVNLMRSQFYTYIQYMNQYYPRAKKVVVESYPTNSATLGFGSAYDIPRRNFDTDLNMIADTSGEIVVTKGYAAAISTTTPTAGGQLEYKPGYSSDNIHMNNTGYTAGAAYIQTMWKKFL